MKVVQPAHLLLLLGLTLQGGTKPGPRAAAPRPKGNCAVCGMYVANFPEWACRVAFKDGSEAWFDGPKDLFTFLHDLKQYAPRRRPDDLTSIQVRDYYALKTIDARSAYFVVGSDVLGPMGKELVPFASEAGARDFLRDHKGVRMLTFQEITPEAMKALD